jgi:hypothetical protein
MKALWAAGRTLPGGGIVVTEEKRLQMNPERRENIAGRKVPGKGIIFLRRNDCFKELR